jgi:hypothetical protein
MSGAIGQTVPMARPRLNPCSGRFEMVEEDWELMYDVAQSSYRYQPPGARPTYDLANDRVANAPSGSV